MTHGRTRWLAIAAAAGVMLITVALLRYEGRRWWCACQTVRPWISDVWSSHCSQHLSDPYSLTHLLHGVIFAGVLSVMLPRRSVAWQAVIAIMLAASWEVLENSAMVIERYRTATMSLDYLGDSVTNALGDIAACVLGFALARRIGWRAGAGLFAAVELGLLLMIRDNLTLNVVMLIWPIDAVRQWQEGG